VAAKWSFGKTMSKAFAGVNGRMQVRKEKFVFEDGLFLNGNNEIPFFKRNNYVEPCSRRIVKTV
jgi:hypothetical protein